MDNLKQTQVLRERIIHKDAIIGLKNQEIARLKLDNQKLRGFNQKQATIHQEIKKELTKAISRANQKIERRDKHISNLKERLGK